MSKRSPRYPSESLPDALERVRPVFDADRQNPIDRATVALHMGYSGISGASDKTISNLMQYGLLERIGKGEVRVSRLAVDILYPAPGSDGAEALMESAFSPQLFADLKSRFDETPSREALKSYLKREGFLERAIGPIASAYLETCSYLEQKGANDFLIPSEPTPVNSSVLEIEKDVPMQTHNTPRTGATLDDVTLKAAGVVSSPHRYPIANGAEAIVTLPAELSEAEFEEFQDWLDLMSRKAKRRISTPDSRNAESGKD